jgi:ParB/RepB/Spo0J family partition protein
MMGAPLMQKDISLTDIVDNPFQPRTIFDTASIQSLAEEMRAEGFWKGGLQGRRRNGHVELVFGHRRLRALRLLNVPSVTVEILDLTDGQMALRALEENLQREGLTDLEKADAVKRTVEVAQTELRAAGKNDAPAIAAVAKRLGLSQEWVRQLCQISGAMAPENRGPIEAGYLTAKTALAAKSWGGNAYVRTLAKQGKQAAKDGSVSKPTHVTVAAMRRAVMQAPDGIQEQLKAEIIAGDVITPQAAEQRARRLAATQTRRRKAAPPDLREVIVGWTHRITEWEKEMHDVIPYMDYVEEVPAIAAPFRAALHKMMTTAQKLL